jgi:hypothetical protein
MADDERGTPDTDALDETATTTANVAGYAIPVRGRAPKVPKTQKELEAWRKMKRDPSFPHVTVLPVFPNTIFT